MSPCAIGLEFYVKLNGSLDDCDVEVSGDQCCLVEGKQEDCAVLEIVGKCRGFVPKGTTKTFTLIAPLLNPYQRHGYCSLDVDSKCSRKVNKRRIVIINFDTRIKDVNNSHTVTRCKETDEDPLNNCKPVDCDVHYNGIRPYYHPKLKRCVEVPACIGGDIRSADVIYNPASNECEEESITDDDIAFIKGLQAKPRRTKDILIIQNTHNKSDIIDTLVEDDRVRTNKSSGHRKVTPAKQHFRMFMKKCMIRDKGPMFILSLVVSLQCCLICVMMYCLTQTCKCCKEKKVIRRFFNTNHDVSITTPLIRTSNIDTETTDYQFVSESSKVDQKIKCYKACQKEITENVRPCMSDDILSKCLNRRDWGKHTRSDVIPEGIETNDKDKVISKEVQKINKVMFEDTGTIVHNTPDDSDKPVKKKTSDKDVEANWSSEREIQCHNYNEDVNVTGFKAGQSKTARFVTEQPRKGTISLSTAKGTQAYFSNDSIDEYLSERGMIYLAGENVSKFTFNTESSELKPSTSSVSSKTSKNFVKQVMSLIQRKSRGHLSDPGGKKDALDLELLHMSKATVYSSSNDSEYKGFRKQKDSRTSL